MKIHAKFNQPIQTLLLRTCYEIDISSEEPIPAKVLFSNNPPFELKRPKKVDLNLNKGPSVSSLQSQSESSHRFLVSYETLPLKHQKAS